MTVVRLKGRTTTSEADFVASNLSINSLVYLDPVDADMQNFSIDVRLGEGWNDRYSSQSTELKKIDQEIVIRKHGSIVVEVAEEIRVPYNRYGIVLPTGSLFLEKGVMITAAKVEPAFHGKLKVRLYNTTNKRVVIQRNAKLGSIIFFTTDTTLITKAIFRRSDVAEPKRPVMVRAWQFIVSYKTYIISAIASLIVGLILASYNGYLSRKPVDESKSNNVQTQTQTETQEKSKRAQ